MSVLWQLRGIHLNSNIEIHKSKGGFKMIKFKKKFKF